MLIVWLVDGDGCVGLGRVGVEGLVDELGVVVFNVSARLPPPLPFHRSPSA